MFTTLVVLAVAGAVVTGLTGGLAVAYVLGVFDRDEE